jgi:hypothetical protein
LRHEADVVFRLTLGEGRLGRVDPAGARRSTRSRQPTAAGILLAWSTITPIASSLSSRMKVDFQ